MVALQLDGDTYMNFIGIVWFCERSITLDPKKHYSCKTLFFWKESTGKVLWKIKMNKTQLKKNYKNANRLKKTKTYA